LFVGVYLIAWCPYAIVSFWSAFGDSSSLPTIVTASPPFLAKSSTVWNPLIYGATNKQFRSAFYNLLPCRSLKDKLVKKEEGKAESSKESDLDDKTKLTSQPSRPTQVIPVPKDEQSQGVSMIEATVVENLSSPNSDRGRIKFDETELNEMKA